jgi:hypothetical protein
MKRDPPCKVKMAEVVEPEPVLRPMRFRPCIDLHDGKVKQIVGASLKDDEAVVENFVSDSPPSYFAELYRY